MGPRNWELFSEHQQTIRDFFVPVPPFTQRAQAFIDTLRDLSYDMLVGVLIRQTDYRNWNGGKYFFTTSQYTDWMKQILDLFPAKNIGFIVASDEQQKPSAFQGLNLHFTSGSVNCGGHYLESLLELSACDLIASPPSTFSAWASFMGNKPLLPLARS